MNGLDLQSQPISNVADPSTAQQAATKNYVDNVAQGIYWKQSVAAASTANVTVSNPGVTTIDGVTLTSGTSRVLLKNQTTGSENGIYVFNGSASALTRATDADDGTELNAGAAVFITGGTVNNDTAWIQTTTGTVTIGTTATTWTQFGGGPTYSAGNGITISSNTISVNKGTGLAFNGAVLTIDHTVVPEKYATSTTSGSSSYTITHNLGTTDVIVQVFDNSGNLVMVDTQAATTNTVVLTFAVNTTVAYRVVVLG